MINFDIFDIIQTRFNPFRHDELKSGFKFGSKKFITRQCDHNIKWNLPLYPKEVGFLNTVDVRNPDFGPKKCLETRRPNCPKTVH